GGKAVGLRADVRDERQLETAFRVVREQLGPVDIVVANAGVCPPLGPAWETSAQVLRDVIDVNLIGVANTLKVAAGSMISDRRRGAIVVTGSGAAVKAISQLAAYVAAK